MITFLAAILLAQQATANDEFAPYSLRAKGEQLRMRAITEALMSFSGKKQMTGSLVVESAVTSSVVRVRVRDAVENKLFEFPLSDVRRFEYHPPKQLESKYELAALAFHKIATEQLSDADPRWTSLAFEIGPSTMREYWAITMKGKPDRHFFELKGLFDLNGRGDGGMLRH